jgi:23S rRNA (uridine2552-2'-O)-methyltransferase
VSPYKRQDHFYKQAKKDAFVARSVYKLEELDERFSVLKPGGRVLDLGCAPGSWLQYIQGRVGKKGSVLAYDIVPITMELAANAKALVASVDDLNPERVRIDYHSAFPDQPSPAAFDAVLSDMAPKLTGIRDADQAKSVGLAEQARQLADGLLREGGVFAAKIFQGRDTDAFILDLKRTYKNVRTLRPEATRSNSREMFVVGHRRD